MEEHMMEGTGTIKERLADRDPHVRRDACEAIGDARNDGFIADLIGALRDDDPGVKEAALNALTAIGGRRVAEAIVPLLRVEDAGLRNIGIEILEQVGAPSLETVATLLGDGDDDVVKFAVDILANLKAEGVAGMLERLITHRNPNVRAAVAVCLGRLKAESAVPLLLKFLDDAEEWVKFSAIEGLGHMQDRRALEPLLDIVDKETGLVMEGAVEAASKLASPEDAARILSKLEGLLRHGYLMSVDGIVALLEKALSQGAGFKPSGGFREVYYTFLLRTMEDADRSARLKALKGLGLLKVPEGLAMVIEYLDSQSEIDEDAEALLMEAIVSIAGKGPLPGILKDRVEKGGAFSRVIVKALGAIGSREAVPLLAGIMQRAGRDELREVVAALEAIGSVESVEVLSSVLAASTDGHTRKTAARAIAKIAGPDSVERLFAALRNECYRDVMEEITAVLASIPGVATVDGFRGLLEAEREALREMGARGLGFVGTEEAISRLKGAAGDPSPNVRKEAYRSMARVGMAEVADAVARGLKDPDDNVKLSVLKSLGGWPCDTVKVALLQALKDKNVWVRYHAVLLLGDMGKCGNEPVIVEILENDEPPVKAAAAKALEKMGSKESLDALERFSGHPDPAVRQAVKNAIEALRC
jgi:HEAT repeat protein